MAITRKDVLFKNLKDGDFFEHSESRYKKIPGGKGQPGYFDDNEWVAIRSPHVKFTPDTSVEQLTVS